MGCFAFRLFLLALLSVSSPSVVGTEVSRLQQVGGNAQDLFGISVGICGNLVVVGAYLDGSVARDAGEAFLFDAITGEQLRSFSPAGHSRGDLLGDAVAIDGDLVAIGSPGDKTGNHKSGSAYVFHAPTGIQVSKLLAGVRLSGDDFGSAIAIHDDVVIVGAKWRDEAGHDSGAAYLFDALDGSLLHQLHGSADSAIDWFGCAVDVDGDLCIVGARYDDPGRNNGGTAYIFDVPTGNQLHRLFASDREDYAVFGTSVALEDGVALVGSPSFGAIGQEGAAYLFDAVTGVELAKLLPPAGTTYNDFGDAVAISDGVAYVGASGSHSCSLLTGTVYMFDIPSGGYLGELIPAGCSTGDYGRSISVDGMLAVMGRPYDDLLGSQSGTAYVMDVSGGSLEATSSLHLGSGTNPGLLSSLSAPVIGQDWPGEVDTTGLPPGIMTILCRGRSASGTFVPSGEILLALDSAPIADVHLTHAAGPTPFSLAIPADGSLAGRTIFVQAWVGAAGSTGTLTNALALSLGY